MPVRARLPGSVQIAVKSHWQFAFPFQDSNSNGHILIGIPDRKSGISTAEQAAFPNTEKEEFIPSY